MMSIPEPETSPAAGSAAKQSLADDARWRAFLNPGLPDVFHPVAGLQSIWDGDFYDVEEIQAEPRMEFDRLLNSAQQRDRRREGRILLLTGDAGCGKTHLMGVFRRRVEQDGGGWFAYLQLTSDSENYNHYILQHVVGSLERPGLDNGPSGLLRLSNALVERNCIPPEELRILREEDDYQDAAQTVSERLLRGIQWGSITPDPSLIQVLVLVQRRDPIVAGYIGSYLRCRHLPPRGQDWLLGAQAPSGPHASDDQLAAIIRIIDTVGAEGRLGAPCVLCVDQMENMWASDDPAAERRFRNAMVALASLADHHPSLVIVLACLDDYYHNLRGCLPKPVVDRIENSPPPVRLTSHCTLVQIEAMISARLHGLYDSADPPAEVDPATPLFPFDPSEIGRLVNLRVRGVLTRCQDARRESMVNGEKPKLIRDGGPDPGDPEPDPELERLWDMFRTEFQPGPLDEEDRVAELLAEACHMLAREAGAGEPPINRQGPWLRVDGRGRPLLLKPCLKGAQGGGLARQVDELEQRADHDRLLPVVVRSADFPTNPKTAIVQKLGAFAKAGGSRLMTPAGDLETVAALSEFVRRHHDHPRLEQWLRDSRPLGSWNNLRGMLGLDPATGIRPDGTTGSGEPEDPDPVPPEPRDADPKPDVSLSQDLAIGVARGARGEPVTFNIKHLTRHAAFLGGSGSGKTTLAVGMIEQLLERGVPMVMIDRKGDLARYADPASWTTAADRQGAGDRLRRLRERIRVDLFTPGTTGSGRPLLLPLMPEGIGSLSTQLRRHVANQASNGLADMMGYRHVGQHQQRRTVLARALEVLAELESEVALEALLDLIGEADEKLVAQLGYIPTKMLGQIAADLEGLRQRSGHLLSGADSDAETLDVTSMFAPLPDGRTPLTVIETRFLGDNPEILFWVSRFLMDLADHVARHPSETLQGAVLFDEADFYLPAVGKPATKDPMENALRRFRSGGLCVMLASQSPGDFDYKCRDNIRTWFVGQVKEATAIAKMRPMLSTVGEPAKTPVAEKLPNQGPGEFFLLAEGDATALKANLSLVKPDQVGEEDLLRLAEATKPGGPL